MKCKADYNITPALLSPTDVGCRGYDFTVAFEDAFLVLAPNSVTLLFIIISGWRGFTHAKVVHWPALQGAKGTFFVLLAALVLSELSLHAAVDDSITSKITVLAHSILLVTIVSLAVLSLLQHSRSLRPSPHIQAYLFLTMLFDIARVRTGWLIHGETTISSLRSAAMVVKVVLLFLESLPKDKHIIDSERNTLSPEDKAGLFSRSLLLWLNPLFLHGYRKPLSGDELYPVGENLAASRVFDALHSSWENTKLHSKFRLAIAMLKAFKTQIFMIQLPRLALVGFSVAQPFLVNATLSYIDKSSIRPVQVGYGLIGASIITYVGIAMSTVWYQHLIFRLMTMIRGSLITMIFRNRLTLPSVGGGDASGPVSLINSDVERVIQKLQWVLNIFPNVIQVALGMWILSMYMDAVCVAPLIIAIVCGLTAGFIGKKIPPRQRAWMQAIQKRVKSTINVISNMKHVKMAGLGPKVLTQIHDLRTDEMTRQKAFRHLQISMITLGNAPAMLTPAVTFTAYAIAQSIGNQGQVQTIKAFTSLSLLSILINPVAELVTATTNLASALSCLDRVQEFFEKENQRDSRIEQTLNSAHIKDSETSSGSELQKGRENSIGNLSHSHETQEVLLRVNCGTFGWTATDIILRDINMNIASPTLTLVTGPTGCGKSTLLRSLLGETVVISGSIECVLPKRIAYCHSEPWILNISIRKNILGITAYDEGRYRRVVEACQLIEDFTQLPKGDETLAGSDGSALSGGQRQRIALARSAYSGKQLILLDDTLSGLDPNTATKCFEALLGTSGLFKVDGKTVIMATNNAQWLPYGDQLIVLNSEGRLAAQGKFQSLVSSNGYLQNLQQMHNVTETGHDVTSTSIKERTLPVRENVTTVKESTEATKQIVASQQGESDIFQQKKKKKKKQDAAFEVLAYYITYMGKKSVVLFAAFIIFHIGCSTAQPIWLKYWTMANDENPNDNVGRWTGIYVLFALVTVMGIAMETGYFLLLLVPRSAIGLHLRVLDSTINAPLSFFVGRDIGEIVNLFTADLTMVDMALPLSFILAFEQLASTLAQLVLTCVASGYLAVAVPILGVVLFVLQRIYLKTSRQLRLLDLEYKAPLIDHFITTISGIITIRAFSWTTAVSQESSRLLDKSQSPFYLIFCLQRWLTLVLDLTAAGLATLLVSIAVVRRDHTDVGLLGVAMVSVMTLGQGLSQLVTHWTNLETSLGAIKRIKTYTSTTPEERNFLDESRNAELSEKDLPPDWPSRGEITFKEVSVSFGNHLVLDKISLDIEAGTKVAICGRTGSGKSTLLGSILRLYKIDQGSITIDAANLATIACQRIRTAVAAVPQEPFFLTGSIRTNADCLQKSKINDDAIWDVLEKTGLAKLIKEKGGLDVELNIDWLSTGQRQLFCLARAMLRRAHVVLLDESTSQVDAETEKLVTKLIRTEMRKCTVILVTHRLKNLVKADSWCDKVILLQQGRVVEMDSPANLAKIESGLFQGMVKAQEA
ncbi:ABC transporter-like protein [Calycina marina]|uniref:ABC transporter-like protein n=1 Tax=Calycina marina TaxID=1763456 RepID=A0A9P8CBB7_9HELO|nr:ABC transporter-like protein [Calycina marina]